MKNTIKKAITITLAVTILAISFTGCAEKKRDHMIIGSLPLNSVEVESREQYMEKNKISMPNIFPEDTEWGKFASVNAMLLELNADKIDAMGTFPKCTVDYFTKLDPSLSYADGHVVLHFAMGTRAGETELVNELNSAITALKENGELDKLIDAYITNLSSAPAPNKIVGNTEGKTYVVGVTGDFPPMDYVAADGIPAGFNIALLNAIAQISGCNFEIVQLDSAARSTAIISGKIDVVFWNYCLLADGFEPKNGEIITTVPYLTEPGYFLTKDHATAQKLDQMIPSNHG